MLILPVAARASPLAASTLLQHAYAKASNTDPIDHFGASVAVSGGYFVVGAPNEASSATGVNGNQLDNSAVDAGAAYVFETGGTGWAQQAYLKASSTAAHDHFGWAVAISGDTLAVGAPTESGQAAFSGAVYVFVRNGTTWTQQAYLKASNAGASDLFGSALALSGDTLIVGAREEDSNATGIGGNELDDSASNSGAAYVFVRNGTSWSQQAYLKASNTGAEDRFGWSVALDGDTAVVGARLEDSNATGIGGNQLNESGVNSGAAYVFTRSGTSWSQQAYVKASNTGISDEFGAAVALSGDTLAVSAPLEDSSATGVNGNQSDNGAQASGAVYVFTRSGASWSQQAYLKASNTDPFDGFGSSLALEGQRLVAGAPFESSNAVGIDGDATDNSLANSGAAYVFARSAGSWSQRAYVKASNTDLGDQFAGALALSGVTLIAGAALEDGSATGINGNQLDNFAADAGAVFAFEFASGIVPLCFGDGSITPCPCSNPSGAGGRGCDNSAGTGGAVLLGSGVPSLAADTLVLATGSELPSATSIVLQGTSLHPGGLVFGQGLRCVAGTLKRLFVRSASAGGIFVPGPADPSISARSAALGDPIGAAQARYYMVYYRDPVVLGSCAPTSTFNATNALAVTWDL